MPAYIREVTQEQAPELLAALDKARTQPDQPAVLVVLSVAQANWLTTVLEERYQNRKNEKAHQGVSFNEAHDYFAVMKRMFVKWRTDSQWGAIK